MITLQINISKFRNLHNNITGTRWHNFIGKLDLYFRHLILSNFDKGGYPKKWQALVSGKASHLQLGRELYSSILSSGGSKTRGENFQIVIGRGLPYAVIQHRGGFLKWTEKRKRFYAYQAFVGERTEFWKALYLKARKGDETYIPPRPFIQALTSKENNEIKNILLNHIQENL